MSSAHTYVTAPVVRLPEHEITTREIKEDVRAHYPDHPQLPVLQRVLDHSGVERRYWTQPLATLTAGGGVEARNRQAFAAACDLGSAAARQALDTAGVTPETVDAVITSHTTSWSVPGLDIHLVEALGLRPTVSRIPLSTAACAGGAQALVRATDYVRAHPGSTVLVTVGEALSTIVHEADDRVENIIYRGLFGDSGAACLVTDRPLGPGLAIHETYECLLPASRDRYWGRLDADGIHFDSTRKAARAAGEALPYVQEWMADWTPSWGIVHPGGPGIVQDVTVGTGLPADASRHALDSLRETGNLGGSAVLDVLRRTHASPPPAGESGLLVAFGPGFTVAAARGTWHT